MRTSIPQTVASSLQNNELFILKERAFVTPLKWKDPLDKDDLEKKTAENAENFFTFIKTLMRTVQYR